jgi:hypothetical protein
MGRFAPEKERKESGSHVVSVKQHGKVILI